MKIIKDFLLSDPQVLPEHLRNWQGTGKPKPHTDWPFWPLTKIPRSFLTKGPRAKEGSKFHAWWPPRLIEGFDLTRWEWADEKGNNAEVHIKEFKKILIGPEVYSTKWNGIDLNDGWWPSIIPTTSEYGWLKLAPWFHCAWRTAPGWRKYYWRVGYRPDFDFYYNPFPYLGRNPE